LYQLNTAYHIGIPSFLEIADLIKDLFRWRSLIVYHEGKEERWTVLMSVLTIALLVFVFVRTKFRLTLTQQRVILKAILHFEDLSGDWRFQHFSNFIALQSKDVARTENYEANLDYFPLCFKSMNKDVVDSLNCIEQKLIMKPVAKDSIYENTLNERLAKGNRIVFENEAIVLLQSTK
jgi:hypothetical protein